jgi:phytanoyl-CoA hydroxylase
MEPMRHFDRVVRKVVKLAPSLGPSWNWVPNVPPWTDRPTARNRILQVDEIERRYVKEWIENGYFVLDDAFSSDEIDSLIQKVDSIWGPDSNGHDLKAVEVRDVRVQEGGPASHYPVAEIQTWNRDRRQKAQEYSNWRIHALHMHCVEARNMMLNARVQRLVNLVMGVHMDPFGSLTFGRGSNQRLHQDMAVFHVHPRKFLVGAWVALEDIHPDAGPLMYCPGSHRSETFHEFKSYPQDNLRTCTPETDRRSHDVLAADSHRFERKQFLAKKGQVLVWHGMLYHGGSPIRNPARTRKSFVMHYLPRFADRTSEVRGPFNWV